MSGLPIVLLVEDEEQDVILTQRAFKKAQISCDLRVATDGDQAVDYLGATGEFSDRAANPIPTLILLDLKLPRRNGHEVLRWLRAQPILKQVPVVMLTSSKESEDLKKAYELGANSYLIKPVSFDELLKMVQAMNLYWLSINQPPPLT
jgi:DNA-binding response OmpR family regulator